MSNITQTVTECFICHKNALKFVGYKHKVGPKSQLYYGTRHIYMIKCKDCGRLLCLGLSKFSMPTARHDAVKTWKDVMDGKYDEQCEECLEEDDEQ